MINDIGLKQAQCWQALCKHQHCKHASILTCSTFSVPICHNSGTDPASPIPDGLLYFQSTQQLEWSGKGHLDCKACDALLLLLSVQWKLWIFGCVFSSGGLCFRRTACGLCTNSWLLLLYEPDWGAEQSCLWCYPGRDFLSKWKVGMGCGPHLYSHREGDVPGVFNQKSVWISSLKTSLGAVSAASCSGYRQHALPRPPEQPGCSRPCRTCTPTAPVPPGQPGWELQPNCWAAARFWGDSNWFM